MATSISFDLDDFGNNLPKVYKPCRAMKHVRPCGPHPSGDTMYCACGCSGADEWCADERP